MFGAPRAEGRGHSTGQSVELRVLMTSGSVVAVGRAGGVSRCAPEREPIYPVMGWRCRALVVEQVNREVAE